MGQWRRTLPLSAALGGTAVAMLKRLLAKRRKIPQNLRNSAESLLKVPTSVYTSMTEFTTDPKPMETHRERLARAIESVQRY